MEESGPIHLVMPATPPTPTRFEALDSWRGLCACLVVLFHCHGYSPLYTSPFVRNSYLFVDFFFVLSGFVIAWNYAARLDSWDAVKRFLILRAGRVYPLHLFMLLCFIAWETYRFLKGWGQPSPEVTFSAETQPLAILTNLFLVHSLNLHEGLTWNGPSWSISSELWTYVVFALIWAWLGMRNWILLVAACAAPLLLLHLSKSGMDATYDYGLIRCLFGFALGVVCFRIHRRWPHDSARRKPLLMSSVETVTVAAVVGFVSAAGTSGWSFLAPFVFSAAVLVFAIEGGAVSRLFRNRFLKWLGMLSYSIYLTHYIFVLLMPRVVKRLVHHDLWTPMPLPNGQYLMAFGRNNLEGTLFYVAVLAVTLAFSAFTYRWVETPGREWTRRWIGKRAARQKAQTEAGQPIHRAAPTAGPELKAAMPTTTDSQASR